MKIISVIYWTSTILVALTMIFSSYSDLFSLDVKTAFTHLGFPGYFRVELGILKILGIVLLLAPLPARFKEWPYVGFSITYISAFIAHTASEDPIANRVAPIIVLLLLMMSYLSYHKRLSANNKHKQTL
jgi:uncharacterized membrane protein YphA (DoxX/SURF4 family)